MTQSIQKQPDYDAIVIGGGVTGIYQVYVLREMGFSVKGIEAAPDVGGTWYWNRYPGCRLDTESYTYGFFCLKGITPDWRWSEKFAAQPELLRYVNHAADVMDIRKDFQFNTKVESAIYDDDNNLWQLRLSDGSEISCRYMITAVGPLSATRLPDIPGIESFAGEAFHTSRWPREPGTERAKVVDFTGKRVGVIGTGATGVQIIPVAAESADELYVFQRTPNWCIPLGNEPLSEEQMSRIRDSYENIFAYIKTTDTAFAYHRHPKRGIHTTPEERQELFERLYQMPGYGLWLGSYKDVLLNKESNKYLADFVADKVRQRVKDPAVAEKLIPKDHPFGAKRVPMETNYYEAFNQDNVHLVDVGEAPITEVTPEGIKTAEGEFELDVIIYATGFDAVTGSLDRIDIRGKGGTRLKDVWADGPLTYLGLQTAGFPNLFTLVGPHNGSAFCNIAVCGGLQVDWVSKMLKDMRNRNLNYSEPDEQAQAKWTEDIYKVFERTLMAEGDAWWVKVTEHPDGTVTRRALAYLNGGQEYRKICDQVAYHDYDGFIMK